MPSGLNFTPIGTSRPEKGCHPFVGGRVNQGECAAGVAAHPHLAAIGRDVDPLGARAGRNRCDRILLAMPDRNFRQFILSRQSPGLFRRHHLIERLYEFFHFLRRAE